MNRPRGRTQKPVRPPTDPNTKAIAKWYRQRGYKYVCDQDGRIDPNALKLTLYLHEWLMDQISYVYHHITDGAAEHIWVPAATLIELVDSRDWNLLKEFLEEYKIAQQSAEIEAQGQSPADFLKEAAALRGRKVPEPADLWEDPEGHHGPHRGP